MSAKKNCVACGKQIPDVAVVCVFCSAKQPSAEAENATDTAAATVSEGVSTATAEGAAAAEIVSKHATDPTLIGIKASDVMAAVKQAESPPPTADSAEKAVNGTAAKATPAVAVEAALPEPEVPEATIPEPTVEPPAPAATATVSRPLSAVGSSDEPWGGLGRLIMGIGGGVLIALFFCPWHGVSSWQLLETLVGADFVRQLFYLTGGVVLLASALLPLPFVFRAAVGTGVAAMPILLGAGGVIEGWRGVVAALAILGLPATHLLRSRAQSSPAARVLVVVAVASVVLLYLLPVSSVVPIAAVFKMISSGSIGLAIMGVFILIPLVFAGLSLLGVLGRDLTDVGVLLSVLILLWAPVVVALRGLLIEDATQLYAAVGLLWASATAALSLAQLLSLAARARPVQQ
jgi:hypothetical protein